MPTLGAGMAANFLRAMDLSRNGFGVEAGKPLAQSRRVAKEVLQEHDLLRDVFGVI